MSLIENSLQGRLPQRQSHLNWGKQEDNHSRSLSPVEKNYIWEHSSSCSFCKSRYFCSFCILCDATFEVFAHYHYSFRKLLLPLDHSEMKSWNYYDVYEPFDKSWSKWSKISSSWLPCEQLSKSGTQRISNNKKRISIVEPQLHQCWFQKIFEMQFFQTWNLNWSFNQTCAKIIANNFQIVIIFQLETWITFFVKPAPRSRAEPPAPSCDNPRPSHCWGKSQNNIRL